MFSKSDSIFGKLERQNQTWVGHYYWFEALQQDIEVNLVYNGENSPSEQEKEAFLDFKTESSKLFWAVEKALFHFLLTNIEHYRQQYDVQDQEIFVPELKNSTEVWEHLEITRIELDSENYQNTCITIICDFKWDEEHGLDIDIHDKKIGISEGGIHWDDKAHYEFDGSPVSVS